MFYISQTAFSQINYIEYSKIQFSTSSKKFDQNQRVFLTFNDFKTNEENSFNENESKIQIFQQFLFSIFKSFKFKILANNRVLLDRINSKNSYINKTLKYFSSFEFFCIRCEHANHINKNYKKKSFRLKTKLFKENCFRSINASEFYSNFL